jgi:hypothetical protein
MWLFFGNMQDLRQITLQHIKYLTVLDFYIEKEHFFFTHAKEAVLSQTF